MKFAVSFIVIAILGLSQINGQAVNYCTTTSLCWAGQPHIGCPTTPVNACGAGGFTPFITSALKTLILNKHNSYRNTLAAGTLVGLTPLLAAKKMPTFQWDDELAFLAQKNANQCQFGHDQCRNTLQFPYAGQNIAWSKNYPSDQNAIERAIDSWWNEYKTTRQSDLNAYFGSTYVIGHFTTMAQDRSNRVGCGAALYNTNERYFVCNYAFTNFYGLDVYETGSTASGCTTGTNALYPNLCSTSEVVSALPW